MFGSLRGGLRNIDILLGDDVRRFLPDFVQPFKRQLLDVVVGQGLMILLFHFRRIDDRQDLILLDGIALVGPDPFQIAGHLRVERRLIEWRDVCRKRDLVGQLAPRRFRDLHIHRLAVHSSRRVGPIATGR